VTDVTDFAEAYIAATNAGDTSAFAEPDVVIWHNFDGLEVDGAASARTLSWLHRTVPDIAWVDNRVTPTPSGFVWQSVMTGSAPSGALHAHTCAVFTLSPAGKIARIEEYVDAAALAPLRK